MRETTIGVTTTDKYVKPMPKGTIAKGHSVWVPNVQSPAEEHDKSNAVYVQSHDLVQNIVNFVRVYEPGHTNAMHASVFLNLYSQIQDIVYDPDSGLMKVDI